MCGFVGYLKNNNNDNIIKEMNNKIYHRGPDSEGYYIDEFVALGFRRLSIIDINSGHQPIYNEDKSKVIIFNGEIYNYKELKEDLIKKGHIFHTDSDTETILHGYEEYKEEILNKLRGMFSFVIFDTKEKKIFGARDFFGIKPFYYYKKENEFIFGSEIKSFLVHPKFEKELNTDALENYLSFQYSVGNDTFFKNVYKLPAGHYFTHDMNKMEIKRYYNPLLNVDESKNLDTCIKEIKDSFNESIQYHKVSDVEVGSFLSSGIDSSYAATVAHVDKTFTVGFDNSISGGKYDEISYAKDLSEKIKSENISQVITKEEYFKELSKIQYHMDEPLADAASIALYFVAKLARKHVKVCLSGEGADELFGGYHTYNLPNATKYSKVPFFIRKAIGKVASTLPEVRGINFLVRNGMRIEDYYIGDCNVFSVRERKKALGIKTEAKHTKEITKPYFDMVQDKDPITKMQYLDINLWLTGDILLKADKMSMANSLEVRVPFLDKELLKTAGSISSDYKLMNNTTKYALRMAAKDEIPTDAYNKRKLGFPVPISKWIRDEDIYMKIREEFSSPTAHIYFNIDYLDKLLSDHFKEKKDNWRKIWCIYIFLIWYKEFFE